MRWPPITGPHAEAQPCDLEAEQPGVKRDGRPSRQVIEGHLSEGDGDAGEEQQAEPNH